MKRDRHHAWHSSLGPRTDSSLERLSLQAASVCAVVPLSRGVFWHSFSTKCCDGSLYSRMERPPRTGGNLFPLLSRLKDLIRTVSVEDIFQGTAFQSKHADELLGRIGKVDWQCTPGFVWYSCSASTVYPFSKDRPATTAEADEVPTPPGFHFSLAPPRSPEARRVSGPRRVACSASTRVPRSQS